VSDLLTQHGKQNTPTENKPWQEIQLPMTNRATHLCKNAMAWLTYKHGSPRMSYHAEFGRSALKGVGIKIQNSKIGELRNSALLGWEAWLKQDTLPCPRVTTSNLVVLRQRVYA